MKRIGFLALLMALPLAATAQFAVFTDNFATSTTNKLSVPGGTPDASSTSYDILSTKAATTNTPVGPGRFRLALNAATTSGFVEAEAIFSASPISLNTVGDFINFTYTFTNTTGTVIAGGTSSYLAQGFFNSAGSPPVSGTTLANAGLNGTAGSTFATGNAANWQGYVSRISGNGGNSTAYTRPLQNGAGTASANQDALFSNTGTGSFNNPAGTAVDTSEATALTLTSGAVYTVSYTIMLADVQTLVITNLLYTGPDTTGALLFSQTNVSSATNTTPNFVTNSFDAFAIGLRNSGTSLNPMLDISSIKISENIFGLPGPSFGTTGGGTGCPGDSFPVGLTGSVTTNDYRIFTNGVFNGTVHTGTGAAFNFTPETVAAAALTNTVQASNTVSGFLGFMSGQVVVAPFGAPVITTQVKPVFAVNNGVGVFSVVSSGSGLGYQWFRNGTKLTDGNEFSGTTTANLVISPVTAGDAAPAAQGYFVVVTNGCGTTAISTTNGLTIQAPGNISWQGGNTNNVWDLATTPNFTNGAGFVVFNNGDNVTFDDSSAFPAVSIGSPFLAPTLITENAGQAYSFTGSGSIIGSGALLMNGFGTLSISNANSFTGGTTISNGQITVGNLFAMGQGPVNLAGGTLYVPLGGSATVGFSNTVNAVGNATFQYSLAGTFGCIMSGQLTGDPGATMTISTIDGNTELTRMRLYTPFTNNANVVLQSSGATMEMANYMPSNYQVFNGIVSGNGGRFMPRTAGVLVFNNTNSFVDQTGGGGPIHYGVFLSSGFVGIGADSVSSVPPTIDASPVGLGVLGINVGAEGGTCGILAMGGSHTIANQIAYSATTNTVPLILGGANNLTFSGEFDLANANLDTVGTNRTLQVTNTAATTFSGLITDNGITSSLIKIGNSTLYINGQATNSGTTMVDAGVLAGTGTILNPVDVETNGSIGGGSSTAIGTLTISSLTLNANGFFRLNKSLSPAQSNDVVTVTGTATGSGTSTLTVSNLGPAIVVGDKFKLFSKAVTGAGSMTVSGAGMNWQNNLAVDGSITALSVNTGPATNPTNLVFSVVGTNFSFSWPADHLGWFLQEKTNSLLTTNGWADVAGSSGTTNVLVPINKNFPMQFFRMSLQP